MKQSTAPVPGSFLTLNFTKNVLNWGSPGLKSTLNLDGIKVGESGLFISGASV